jgi:hypothetical protein
MNMNLKNNIKSNIKKENETSMSDNKIKDDVKNDTENKEQETAIKKFRSGKKIRDWYCRNNDGVLQEEGQRELMCFLYGTCKNEPQDGY